MFGSHTRDELRQAYADAWSKRSAGRPLTGLEAQLADIIESHPEYQALVQSDAAARTFEPSGPSTVNPFLHMGLHMAVREQLSVDRPPGLRSLHRRLEARYGRHGADHVLMEALQETLAEAQGTGAAPDETRYVDRVRARAAEGKPG